MSHLPFADPHANRTLLPDDVAATAPTDSDPFEVAAEFPASSLAWAVLAEEALDDDKAVTAYAYARTGYHRGLDQLRRNGWKGFGPVPFSHEPNQGFLRCVAALARAADDIGAMIAGGATVMLVFQAFLNIACVISTLM